MLNQLKDVFSSFQKHEVRYLVIGGIAAVLHGVPRATFDLAILIEATPENAQRLLDALLAAQLGTAALTSTDEILSHEITIFKDRVRIDVQTTTPGITFESAKVNSSQYSSRWRTFVIRGNMVAPLLKRFNLLCRLVIF